MSWGGGSNLIGDSLTVCSALAYAFYIIILSARSSLHPARTLTAIQLVAMALFSNLLLVATHWHRDALKLLLAQAQPVLPSIIYLGLIASAGTIFLQAVGQRYVPAQQAAVIYAMEPVFAALFGWLWLSEAMSMRAMTGATVVVVSVILGEWRFTSDKSMLNKV